MPKIETNFLNDKTAVLTFQSEESNSLSSEQLQLLSAKINELSNSSTVKSILLQSEGKVFCAGANFNELLSLKTLEESTAYFLGFANLINAIRKCSKLIVCKVQGKAVGGGVGIIAAADFVIASELAAIKLSELSIGIGPYVISPAIRRKMGDVAYQETALTPDLWKDAKYCFENKLFNEVVAHDILSQHCLSFVSKYENYNNQAITTLKKDYWEDYSHWDDLLLKKAEKSAKLVLTEYCQNKLKSFLKKK